MAHRALLRLTVCIGLAVLAPKALAHHVAADAPGTTWQIVLVLLFATSALLYAAGVARLWRKAGVDRGIRSVEAARFTIGWLLLVAALISPLDSLADRSFAVHMVQHELLMVVAAPLLVLSRPLQAFAWALPAGALHAFAAMPRSAWRALTAPSIAWTAHALAIWLWHVPALFVAALADPSLHVLQHACFFASALMFWQAVFGSRAPQAPSVACLFTTMLHTSALAMLLTFATTPWYAHDAPAPFGMTLLEDQQLGGLIMWVPGGLAYVVAVLAIVTGWLRQARTSEATRRI